MKLQSLPEPRRRTVSKQIADNRDGEQGEYRSSQELEEIIVWMRLDLYNRGLPCGAKVLRRTLAADPSLRPLPSERSIGRILARNGLTYSRTGWYEGDVPCLPARATLIRR